MGGGICDARGFWAEEVLGLGFFGARDVGGDSFGGREISVVRGFGSERCLGRLIFGARDICGELIFGRRNFWG